MRCHILVIFVVILFGTNSMVILIEEALIGTTDARVACFLGPTSAKLQTFAYNSRTVWSSYMKFGQQLENNKIFV